MALEIVAATDPLIVDEYLGCRLHSLTGLECFNVLTTAQNAVLDVEPGTFEQRLGAHAERTGVIGQDHAVECGSGHRVPRCNERSNPIDRKPSKFRGNKGCLAPHRC